ncbi:MAG: outer membrane beta-barrel protein [Bacteroidia bacterium]|nr:outer membrane beta-barrel protein [Bacteroidia bacterium]
MEKESLKPASNVNVSLRQKGKIVALTLSIENGSFQFKNMKRDTYELVMNYIGMAQRVQTIILNNDKYIGTIFLNKEQKVLKEITIENTQTRVTQNGDTTSINAGSFKVNTDATTEDLLKKMPGITIENGVIKAQGEEVRKVLLDGKEFFGEDAQMALKNLPAEIVEKVQIFNRLSDQGQFTGFNDGNTDKTINIVTKPGRNNGTFGKIYAGYGTVDRYQSGFNLNMFNGNRRVTILGISNNINQQNFSNQDLFGGTATAPRIAGMPGGMGRGGTGGGGNSGGGSDISNFLVGQQAGISQTNSFGLNYADKWGLKTQLSGSYFFNNSNTTTGKSLQRHYLINPEINQLYNETSNYISNNYNNRFNLRIEHTFDSFNIILFTPKISFQNNETTGSTKGLNNVLNKLINSSETNKDANNIGVSFNSNLLYRHKYLKTGRTISFNAGNDFNQKTNRTDQNSQNSTTDSTGLIVQNNFKQRAVTNTNGYTYLASITYTEPITKSSQLLISYSPSYTKNQANKVTKIYDSTSNEYDSLNIQLSNKLDNIIIVQKGNLGYNLNVANHSFSAGLSPQFVALNSDQIFPQRLVFNKKFFNILPNFVYAYKFNTSKTIRVVYRTNTNTPAINQLQNVIDNSNPFLLSSGNADLKQEFSHTALIRYGINNIKTARSFFVFAMWGLTNNAISNATYMANKDTMLQNGVILQRGSQLSKPVNINGNVFMRTFITYGLPVKKLRSNLNLNLGANYSSTPGLINYRTNFVNTLNLTGGFVLGSNISQQIDFTVSHNANINLVRNTLQAQQTNNYFINTSVLKATLVPFKVLVISTDLSYTNYLGLGSAFNQNFLLWNASIAYKFFKSKAAEFRFSVFDILKQNNSISRTVTETYIEDSKSNILQRYFMLTFTYNLRKFVSSASDLQKHIEKPFTP